MKKTEFEKWCESFSIKQVLKRFGITALPGDRVVLKNFYLGEQTIRIAEDDRHYFNVYGVGCSDEF
ncbi:hypothetical protein P9H32_12910 [Pontiella sp. NLcol2]|uniref:Uncharacterized protein n=1 Tax=Pontiella agarivorans TaxID=3038953 RepID=A0ABU5MZA6_9BACT|nr:hypothetical protein [Pontiella agarivorans]